MNKVIIKEPSSLSHIFTQYKRRYKIPDSVWFDEVLRLERLYGTTTMDELAKCIKRDFLFSL